MMEITINFESGDILIDGVNISLIEGGGIIPKLAGVAHDIGSLKEVEGLFNISEKFTVLGCSASIAIRYNSQSIISICILFDEIVFFDRNLLESKIIKKFEKKYALDIKLSHPALATIDNFSWGEARFLYDPRQGDLSFCFLYNDEAM